MKRIRLLYIVSTLQKGGPTNQLYNVIKYLDYNIFEPILLTLSAETKRTKINNIKELGVKCYSLNLGRIEGFFLILPRLIKFLKIIKPDIIHSQGIRANLLSLFYKRYCKSIITTIHNYAYEDYRNKYGFLGTILAKIHLFCVKKSDYLIACSEKLSERLSKINIKTFGISNGIDNGKFKPDLTVYKKNDYIHPIFIVSGSIIKGKNNIFLVKFFEKYFENNNGTLIFIGDGVEKDNLKTLAKNSNINFIGRVENPEYYLQQSDIIISSSKTEGLPMSILEGLGCGLLAVLSNIPAHLEFKEKMPDEVFIFDIDNEIDFEEKINKALESLNKVTKKDISEKLKKNFSAEKMSEKYQYFYLKSLSRV